MRTFKNKPKTIKAIKFLGNDNMFPWLKTCGIKLPENERVGRFWNTLHDTELEVEYGDWIVCTDMNDLYPIKESVLFRDYVELDKE